MPFEAYLTAKFKYSHENEMFAALVKNLMAKFGGEPELHVLIGNIMFEGQDLDAIFLKPNGICVIEMKSHGGKVHFMESTPWIVGTSEVIGGSKPNPFQQVKVYRFGTKNFFRNRENEILARQRLVKWDYISAVVLFGKPIQFDDYVLGGLRAWFGITDLPRIADYLAAINNEALRLETEEIRKILALNGVGQRYLYQSSNVLADVPIVASPAPVLKPLQLVYLKEFSFRERRELVGNRGGSQSQAAQQVAELLEQVRQGQNPFTAMASRPDVRVHGYHLCNQCRLRTALNPDRSEHLSRLHG